jgi:predicted site-specific integrase-resolvase
MSNNYVSRKELIKTLDIHYHTVYNLVKNNKIETIKIGNISKYNLGKYIADNKMTINKTTKKKICYCRVSSNKQNNDLERQINLMQLNYPNYEIISDIGSGLNFKRKGLEKIINMAIKGEIEEVVITYKDRLARFGYDLIEMILNKYSNAKITIINQNKYQTEDEELVKDIISIMNVYVAKINGMRKSHKNLIKK